MESCKRSARFSWLLADRLRLLLGALSFFVIGFALFLALGYVMEITPIWISLPILLVLAAMALRSEWRQAVRRSIAAEEDSSQQAN
jgi:hypothetical protein